MISARKKEREKKKITKYKEKKNIIFKQTIICYLLNFKLKNFYCKNLKNCTNIIAYKYEIIFLKYFSHMWDWKKKKKFQIKLFKKEKEKSGS